MLNSFTVAIKTITKLFFVQLKMVRYLPQSFIKFTLDIIVNNGGLALFMSHLNFKISNFVKERYSMTGADPRFSEWGV